MRQFLVGGNWKMNGNQALLDQMSTQITHNCIIAVPSCYLYQAQKQLPKNIIIAAQNTSHGIIL